MQDELFIVWSPKGLSNPRVKHNNYAQACEAAEGMARRHEKQEFIVMRACTGFEVKPDPVQIKEYPQDDIPF